MLVKVCLKCNIEQPITEFHKNKLGRDGRQPRCKTCLHQAQREYRKSNGYGASIKYKYGITLDVYNSLKREQQNKCKLCAVVFDSTKSRLTIPVIDHCHTSNKIRGIICHACNVALGMVKDNPITLQNMIDYLNGSSQH